MQVLPPTIRDLCLQYPRDGTFDILGGLVFLQEQQNQNVFNEVLKKSVPDLMKLFFVAVHINGIYKDVQTTL